MQQNVFWTKILSDKQINFRRKKAYFEERYIRFYTHHDFNEQSSLFHFYILLWGELIKFLCPPWFKWEYNSLNLPSLHIDLLSHAAFANGTNYYFYIRKFLKILEISRSLLQ